MSGDAPTLPASNPITDALRKFGLQGNAELERDLIAAYLAGMDEGILHGLKLAQMRPHELDNRIEGMKKRIQAGRVLFGVHYPGRTLGDG